MTTIQALSQAARPWLGGRVRGSAANSVWSAENGVDNQVEVPSELNPDLSSLCTPYTCLQALSSLSRHALTKKPRLKPLLLTKRPISWGRKGSLGS